MAELQIDALPGRFGCNHDLCLLPEVPLRGDTVPQLHAAVDDRYLEPLSVELLGQEVQGVLVLGEDQQLEGPVPAQSPLVEHAKQFVPLDFGSRGLGVLGLSQQRPHHLEFGPQLLDRAWQPLLKGTLLRFPAFLLS